MLQYVCMRWRLGILLSILGGLLLVIAVPPLRNEVKTLLTYNACNIAQLYKIGSIDSRFGLSNAEVEDDIQQAIGIWNTVEGKTLFTQSEKAKLSVNFVYDQRQALNSQVQQLDTDLGLQNATLQQKIDDFKSRAAAYEQELAAFEALVNKYNSQGGAPPDVYKGLVQQQYDLNSQAQTLNATAKELNLSTHDYNTNVSNLHEDIDQLNAELTQKPEEGLYNGKDLTITIYLTNSKAELIHTLAHEFGHALGMMHVKGESSIMYSRTSSFLTPTSQDLVELAYVCRPQSLVVHEAVVFDEWLLTQVQTIQQHFLKK